MLSPGAIASIMGGTRQADRGSRAFEPGWAPVDDRSVSELLDFTCRFAGLVNYYDVDNRMAGDWVEFLTREPVVTLASVAATDLREMEGRLAALEHRTRVERRFASKRRHFVAMCNAMLDLPRQINRWHRGLSVPGQDVLGATWHERIDAAIDGTLRASVQQLRAYDLGAGQPGALDGPLCLDYSGFSSCWRLQDVRPEPSIYVGVSALERIDRCLPCMLPLWRGMADRVADWGAAAGPQLSRTLSSGRAVPPHIALLIAFARLYDTAQGALNALGDRRTEFYYRAILREHPRPAVADAVHVAFQPAPGREPVSVTIPTGARLAAGKDTAGRDVVYASRDAITVTPAALRRVLTLRVVSGPLFGGAGGPLVTERVLARELSADADAQTTWATFGSTGDAPADLGFAIGSPALELSGGERTVRVEIRHAPHPQGTRDVLSAIGDRAGVNGDILMDRVLASAFALSVSTAGGWMEVPRYEVTRPADRRQTSFFLQFTLPATAPAVAPLAGAPGTASAPVLRMHLRQQPMLVDGASGQFTAYPLSVLSSMRVTDVRVHVRVVGLPRPQVFNPDAQVDPSRPFPAFGAVPTVGASLRIRHAELFAKHVDRLAVRIGWFDLPASRSGFAGYYRHYVVDADGIIRHRLFDNRSFRAAVSVESPGSWTVHPAADQAGPHLFRTAGKPDGNPAPHAPVLRESAFEIPVSPLGERPAAYQPSDGALRIELREPPYAFGHTLYAPNAVHAVLNGLPGTTSGEGACRADFAILEEARQQLHGLLEAGRIGRSRLLQAISPASWPRRAGDHLRGAYLNVTEAWRAYLGRHAGRESASDWIVRSRSVDAGDDAVDTPVDTETYRHMVQLTIQSAAASLLDAAAACLTECVSRAEDHAERDDIQGWRERLDDAGGGGAPPRLAALRAVQMRLDDPGSGIDGFSGLLRKCDALLQAASWVQDCDTDTDQLEGRYTRSVRANLRACISLMQALYETSVKSCLEGGHGAGHPLPNPPFLPQIDRLSVDYTATGRAEFCHLLPFGGWRERPLAVTHAPTLLPQFAHAGNLYLGISGLTTPQTLSLFLRQCHGEPAHDEAPTVGWEYLSGDRWVAFGGPLSRDATTYGLRTSGTMTLRLPAMAAHATTILPADCQWLRAAVRDVGGACPQTLAILLHAVTAERLAADAAGDLERPLPPRRITGLVTPVKGIAAVSQPMPSFGGRPAESDRAFQTRLSERLRHRNRAVAAWDYERLVLERFPMIWKARVLAARRRRAGEADGTVGPGHVRIVIVPGPDWPEAMDSTTPLVGRERLAAIEAAVSEAAGRTVRCHVLNPVYVRLRVKASVQWRGMEDPQAAASALHAAIVEYLSPWHDMRRERVDRTEPGLVQFIRSQPEVAAIDAIALTCERVDAAVADPERCLLTSAPAHDIRSAAALSVGVVEGY